MSRHRAAIVRAIAALVLTSASWLVGDTQAVRADQHVKLDVTGNWCVEIEHDRRRCHWLGQVRLDQATGALTGEGEATPSHRLCPLLKGAVKGSVTGSEVRFGFATGRLGTGEFAGDAAPDGRTLTGTWAARSAAGTWRAERIE